MPWPVLPVPVARSRSADLGGDDGSAAGDSSGNVATLPALFLSCQIDGSRAPETWPSRRAAGSATGTKQERLEWVYGHAFPAPQPPKVRLSCFARGATQKKRLRFLHLDMTPAEAISCMSTNSIHLRLLRLPGRGIRLHRCRPDSAERSAEQIFASSMAAAPRASWALLPSGVLSHGGQVTGIIPEFLMDMEATRQSLGQLRRTDRHAGHARRKHKMFERADAFVALPGGIGTLEEIIEIMTWAQLGRHRKPIVFANISGFWDPMMKLIDHMRPIGFIHTAHLVQPIVIDDADARSFRRCLRTGRVTSIATARPGSFPSSERQRRSILPDAPVRRAGRGFRATSTSNRSRAPPRSG